jgi:hypothetical protein
MDGPSLITLVVVIVAGAVIVQRVVLESAGRASDGLAQLFVPPDWRLPWPRGVQEDDDPWGWQSGADVTRSLVLAATAALPADRPIIVDLDGPDPDGFVSDVRVEDVDPHGVVVPLSRVTRS